MDLKTQLQALMASSLVVQPRPAFGRTTSAKAFGYEKFLFLWVMCCYSALFRVYFYGRVFAVCLPAFISGGGGKGVIFCFLYALPVWTSWLLHMDFLLHWAATTFPYCHPSMVFMSVSAVAHKFHNWQTSFRWILLLLVSPWMTAAKTDLILLT